MPGEKNSNGNVCRSYRQINGWRKDGECLEICKLKSGSSCKEKINESYHYHKLVEYLEVEIQLDGSISVPKKVWRKNLGSLEKKLLNPIQKIEAIGQMIAKIQFQLRLNSHRLEKAGKITRLICKSVNRIRH